MITIEQVQPSDAGSELLVPSLHGVDERWVVRDGESVEARLSLWTRHVPTLPGERLGLIGHYLADDPAHGHRLLQHACQRLTEAGCTLAVGPMDGSTWRSYRFVTEGDGEPPFFMEPNQPPAWPAHWKAAGFGALAGYHSTATNDLAEPADEAAGWRGTATRLADEHGIRLRPLDPARWDDELRRIHAVARVSFVPNFLYTPISEEDFLALYAPLRGYARPEFILFAEDGGGQPAGFVFGLPDLQETARGLPLATLIVKTVAVLPGRAQAGLGRVLVGAAHAAAREAGFRRAVHALMHDGNVSRRLSARFDSRVIRRYTLFSRRLAS